jgi:hypothetical protein
VRPHGGETGRRLETRAHFGRIDIPQAHRARHSTANASRRAAAQDVPTMTGSGFTGFAALQWYGVAGRAGSRAAPLSMDID